MTIKTTVSQEADLNEIEVPDEIFRHPLIGQEKGEMIPLAALGQQAADKLVETFLDDFYAKAGVNNPWQRRNYR